MLEVFLEHFNAAINNLSKYESKLLYIQPIKTNRLHTLLKSGFWSILFIGGDGYFEFGLRIMPNRHWKDWPIVAFTPSNTCFTIGPGVANLFEFIKFFSVAQGFGNLDFFVANADQFYKVTAKFNKILGSNQGVKFFNEFVWQIAAGNGDVSKEAANKLIVDFWSYFDHSEEHILLRNTINQMIEDREYIPKVDSSKNYGIWQTRLYHLLKSRARFETLINKKINNSLLINCFEEPHFIDVEYADVDQNYSRISSNPISDIYSFSERLIDACVFDEMEENPVCQVIKSLYQKGKDGYVGYEHIQLAAIQDNHFNQPLRAWNSLVNAAYWSGRNLEESLFPVWELAINVCKDHRWTDAQYALEYQLNIYNELQK